jgi:hypothetical protein
MLTLPLEQSLPQLDGEPNLPLLVALPGEGDEQVVQVHVLPLDGQDLINASAGVGQRQHDCVKAPVAETCGLPGDELLDVSNIEGGRYTLQFVEMWTAADFPCVEIGFEDKTALLVIMDTCLTMEPVYSDWKTGNQRFLRRWPAVACR